MTDPQTPAGPDNTPAEDAIPAAAPEAPAAPEVPAADVPAAPAAPEAPEGPVAPEAPAAPEAPVAPEAVAAAAPVAAPAPAPAPEPAYAAAPPAYAAAPPAYGAPAPTASEPGKVLGIVSLVVVFFFSLVGLILGYVARSQSKAAGLPNTPAKIAIILGWVFIALSIIAGIVATIFFISVAGNVVNELCSGMDPGVYELTDGTTITCP